jgi:hypothetical protein
MTTGGDLNLLGVVVAASVVSRGPVASCWAGGPWACASGACVSSTCETRSSWAVSGEASSALGLVGVSSRPRSVDRSILASTPEADGGDAQELPDNRSSSVTGEGMGTSLPSKEGAVGAVSWFRQTGWASWLGVGAAGLAPEAVDDDGVEAVVGSGAVVVGGVATDEAPSVPSLVSFWTWSDPGGIACTELASLTASNNNVANFSQPRTQRSHENQLA